MADMVKGRLFQQDGLREGQQSKKPVKIVLQKRKIVKQGDENEHIPRDR